MGQDIELISTCFHRVIRQMKISKDEIEYTIDIVATEDIKGKFITVFYIVK